MSRRYVLDANAILDFLVDGPGAGRVERLLEEACLEKELLLISVVNWGEIFYHWWQRYGEESARSTMARLQQLPMDLIAVDLPQTMQAAEIKARHKIPYVDCIAAALAMTRNATLVTADSDFNKLGRRIQVLWLTRP